VPLTALGNSALEVEGLDSLPEAKRPRQDLASASVGDSPMGLPPPVTDASAKAQQSGRSLTPADLLNPSAAPHPVQSEIGRHRSVRSAVNQEAKVEGLELHDVVMGNYDWEERQKRLEKAKARRAEGALTDEDVYLLNWFLVGDCKCFKENGRWWSEVKGARYEEVWKRVRDPELLAQMATSPVHQYICTVLDSLEESGSLDQPGIAYLYSAPAAQELYIQHCVTIFIDTDGKILSRGRAGGQFTKLLNGGGAWPKTLGQLAFEARLTAKDEYGLSLNNSAILEISPPKLMIARQHTLGDGARNRKQIKVTGIHRRGSSTT